MNDGIARNDRYDTVVHQNNSAKGGMHRSHSTNTIECRRQSGQNVSSDLYQRNQMLMQIRSSSRVYPPKTTNVSMNDGTARIDRYDRRHSISAIDSKTQIVCTSPHVPDRHAGYQRTQSSCRSRSATMDASMMRGDQHDTTLHTYGVSKWSAHRR